MQGGMVNLDASLLHYFLDLAVTQRIGHAPQDDVTLEVAAFELDRHRPQDPTMLRSYIGS